MRIKNRIFVVFSCIYRQKHSPAVESDYSRHPQNNSCSTRTFKTLVCSWSYAVDWQLLHQSRISKEAKDQKFRRLCWHTKLNRKNISKEVKDKKMEKGEIIARLLCPVTVLKWRDKSNVTMVSTYHNADTQRVSNKGKETKEPLCVIDYNNMGGVDLKDNLLHMYMVERKKKITKWYLKLFKRLLNSTVLNLLVVYWQVTGRNMQQLTYRIHLVEGLFMKYAHAVECTGATGIQQQQFYSWLKDIFWQKWHPKLKNQNFRGGVLCAQSTEKRKFQCAAAKYVKWAFAWKIALSCITQSSITEVVKIILLHLYSFKISLLKF